MIRFVILQNSARASDWIIARVYYTLFIFKIFNVCLPQQYSFTCSKIIYEADIAA